MCFDIILSQVVRNQRLFDLLVKRNLTYNTILLFLCFVRSERTLVTRGSHRTVGGLEGLRPQRGMSNVRRVCRVTVKLKQKNFLIF